MNKFFSVRASVFFRLIITIALFAIPFILLSLGIYGSFIFTFSIPLIWEWGFRARPLSAIGLHVKSITFSVITGAISGCILGLLGGFILKYTGITGYLYSKMDSLRLTCGLFTIEFPLQKELGYRLLASDSVFMNTVMYFVFCVFIIGVGEEMFWRGFLQRKISRFFPAHAGVWITAILFALIHFYIFIILPFHSGILLLVLIALAGVTWGYMSRYFDTIWSCAVSHGFAAFMIWKYFFFKH